MVASFRTRVRSHSASAAGDFPSIYVHNTFSDLAGSWWLRARGGDCELELIFGGPAGHPVPHPTTTGCADSSSSPSGAASRSWRYLSSVFSPTPNKLTHNAHSTHTHTARIHTHAQPPTYITQHAHTHRHTTQTQHRAPSLHTRLPTSLLPF